MKRKWTSSPPPAASMRPIADARAGEEEDAAMEDAAMEDEDVEDEAAEEEEELMTDVESRPAGPGTGRVEGGTLPGSIAVSMTPTSTNSISSLATPMRSGGICTP